jgi:hypothetical protein
MYGNPAELWLQLHIVYMNGNPTELLLQLHTAYTCTSTVAQ